MSPCTSKLNLQGDGAALLSSSSSEGKGKNRREYSKWLGFFGTAYQLFLLHSQQDTGREICNNVKSPPPAVVVVGVCIEKPKKKVVYDCQVTKIGVKIIKVLESPRKLYTHKAY